MIALYIFAFSVIALFVFGLCYTLFVPHTLRFLVEDKRVTIRFGVLKIFDTSKKKKRKKPEVENSYIKIPTPQTVKKLVKSALQVYAAEKDEALSVIKQIVTECNLSRCDLSVVFGTGDAALTAILYGVGWQIITAVYSVVIKTEELRKNINIAFTPKYEEIFFSYKIDTVLKITLFKHLKLLLKGYKIVKRNKHKFI